ncbi:hypothetical protein GCM10022221_68060 [Actinocorallia aurea]
MTDRITPFASSGWVLDLVAAAVDPPDGKGQDFPDEGDAAALRSLLAETAAVLEEREETHPLTAVDVRPLWVADGIAPTHVMVTVRINEEAHLLFGRAAPIAVADLMPPMECDAELMLCRAFMSVLGAALGGVEAYSIRPDEMAGFVPTWPAEVAAWEDQAVAALDQFRAIEARLLRSIARPLPA